MTLCPSSWYEIGIQFTFHIENQLWQHNFFYISASWKLFILNFSVQIVEHLTKILFTLFQEKCPDKATGDFHFPKYNEYNS